MRFLDLIEKKKLGEALTKEEIEFMISGYTNGSIPDYQMSAMTMAICLKGMNMEETVNLTYSMHHSGDVINLEQIPGIKVDKHSSGGVGDKTSIALIPWVASCGARIAKMSGRGLGFTGGTLDKLESFPGFSSAMSEEHFENQVETIGCVIGAQTGNLVPADKKLYALRDATQTVDNISLISSSIMSKKLASGADAIVLDVKSGSGAFMKTKEASEELARTMVAIGKECGRRICAVVSNMDEPLGRAVGNALEVREAIQTLNGQGPADFTELCYALGSRMLMLSDVCKTEEEARALMKQHQEDGSALQKLADLVAAQGGDNSYVFHPENLPLAQIMEPIWAPEDGVISHIECDEVGNASMILGGGRETKEDEIDLSVGIVLEHKVGDVVKKGDVLATLFANDREKLATAKKRLLAAYTFAGADEKIEKLPIILESVD